MTLGIARVSRIGVPHFGQSGTSLFGSVEVITAAEPPITSRPWRRFLFLCSHQRLAWNAAMNVARKRATSTTCSIIAITSAMPRPIGGELGGLLPKQTRTQQFSYCIRFQISATIFLRRGTARTWIPEPAKAALAQGQEPEQAGDGETSGLARQPPGRNEVSVNQLISCRSAKRQAGKCGL
jgi:hypothetical protein